jgi:hypothetical protein
LIGAFVLLTPGLAQDPAEELPLPLASSVMYEQYDKGTLYRTHFEAPYNRHPCQPRKIHLSPSSDVDPSTNLYNASVSFTLDTSSVAKGDMLRTRVTYGRGDSTEGSVVIDYEDGDFVETRRNKITEEYALVRFNYTSPDSGKYYESDLIHHVLMKNLEAGKQRYWYTIRVELEEEMIDAESSRYTSHFFPPLNRPLDSYASQLPMGLPRFFLRGSYARTQRLEREQAQMRRRGQELTPVLLGETPTYEFTTPPLYGSPTSIALVGDLGQTKNSTRTMARILGSAKAGSYEATRHNADDGDSEDRLVTNLFIAGDLSYSDGLPERWESWLDLAEPLLREVPFVSVPGNHEVECDKLTRDVFVPYESFFRNPNRIQEAIEIPPSEAYIDTMKWGCATPSEFLGQYDYGNAYFSYRQGLVHTIFLNSYAALLDGSKQREWLMETALPEVDRSVTPWLVVIFHTPLYTTFSNHYGELNPELMTASGLKQVFEDYKVNLVVSGHDHAYLRTKAMDGKGGVRNDGAAPIFWTLGAGGNREGHAKYRNPDQPEDWVAKRNNDEFGFGLFFAPNRTHAHLRWMRDEDNGDEHAAAPGNASLVMRDSVWIENYV